MVFDCDDPTGAEPTHLTWRSSNDLEVTLLIGFEGAEDPPVAEADKLGLLTVFLGERDIVESDIVSTADITHDKLRAEVEWALGVAIRAAADARAGRPGPWIDSKGDEDAARIRGLLDRL